MAYLRLVLGIVRRGDQGRVGEGGGKLWGRASAEAKLLTFRFTANHNGQVGLHCMLELHRNGSISQSWSGRGVGLESGPVTLVFERSA